VTVIETPPLKVVGLVGYIETPRGLRALATVCIQHLDQRTLRRFYKNWVNSKKKAFTNYHADEKKIQVQLNRIKKYCSVVRVVAHTQMNLMKNLRQKINNIFEIQINGGKDITEKIEFGKKYCEQEIRVDPIFKENELIDVIDQG
jgi:large subunit ribosomal protein L3e